MSAKKKKRHKLIEDIVLERGALSVGALAEVLDVSTQTIRRDVDKLCEGGLLKRRHGRVELSPRQSNTHLIKGFRPIWRKSVILARLQQS